MSFSEPDLRTKLIFNGTSIVDVSTDYEDSVWVQVYHVDDGKGDLKYRSFMLEPDEVDTFICILNMYKNRIVNGRKNRREDE